MTLDDRKMRGDVERRELLDGGMSRVDAGHSYIPPSFGSASLAAQCPTQNLQAKIDDSEALSFSDAEVDCETNMSESAKVL